MIFFFFFSVLIESDVILKIEIQIGVFSLLFIVFFFLI